MNKEREEDFLGCLKAIDEFIIWMANAHYKFENETDPRLREIAVLCESQAPYWIAAYKSIQTAFQSEKDKEV